MRVPKAMRSFYLFCALTGCVLCAEREASGAAESSTNLVPGSSNIVQTLNREVIESRLAATNGLVRFHGLVTPSNFELMGFSSTNQAASAWLGKPFPEVRLMRKDLTNYNVSKSFNELVTNAWRVIYPVMVGTNTAASSTILRFSQGQWRAVGWGKPDVITNLTRLRDALSNDLPVARRVASEIVAVEVPTLSTWMIGFFDSQGTAVFYASVDLASKNPTTNHVVSPFEMEGLAQRTRRYRGGSN
jgi:hypothetical protein